MNRSLWMAAALALAIVIWMAVGMAMGDNNDKATDPSTDNNDRPAMTVKADKRRADTITREIRAHGSAEPERHMPLKVETTGRVAQRHVEDGQQVEQGQLLIELAMDDRRAKQQEAEAAVAEAESQLASFERLKQGNYQSDISIKQARAALQRAKAELAAIELDIERTRLRAPYSGVIDRLIVEQGEFVSAGQRVGGLVDNHPLVITANIAQQHIGRLAKGQSVAVNLATGQSVSGPLRFISPVANTNTRTFAIEVAVNNQDGTLPSGVSAKLIIPTEKVKAHFVSPALMSLHTDGTLGVKSVDDNNQVHFHPVEIVDAKADGIWVSGLPDSLALITEGQAFVSAGETVDVQWQGMTAQSGS